MEELHCLLDTPSLRISYDTVNKWLYTQWFGLHDMASIQLGANKVYTYLKETPSLKILSDHSELIGNWHGAAPWLRPWYFDRLAVQGVQYFAWVYAPGYTDRVTMERTCHRLTQPIVAIFNDVASAYDWLRTCPTKPFASPQQ